MLTSIFSFTIYCIQSANICAKLNRIKDHGAKYHELINTNEMWFEPELLVIPDGSGDAD